MRAIRNASSHDTRSRGGMPFICLDQRPSDWRIIRQLLMMSGL